MQHHLEQRRAKLAKAMGCGGSKPAADKAAEADPREASDTTAVPEESESLDEHNPLTKAELRDRVVGSEAAETFRVGETGFILRYACLSQRGYYPDDLYKANQDSYKVVTDLNGKTGDVLFGVFVRSPPA